MRRRIIYLANQLAIPFYSIDFEGLFPEALSADKNGSFTLRDNAALRPCRLDRQADHSSTQRAA